MPDARPGHQADQKRDSALAQPQLTGLLADGPLVNKKSPLLTKWAFFCAARGTRTPGLLVRNLTYRLSQSPLCPNRPIWYGFLTTRRPSSSALPGIGSLYDVILMSTGNAYIRGSFRLCPALKCVGIPKVVEEELGQPTP